MQYEDQDDGYRGFEAGDEDWDDDGLEDDTTSECCPSCGDDSGSCVCYVVLSWEGEWLRSDGGDIDRSSLDRILEWGHALSIAGAPPMRTCDLLAGLPESLAADVESYWVDVAAKVDAGELEDVRRGFLAEGPGDSSPAEDEAFDPSDARHPRHGAYLDALVNHFDEWVLQDHDIRMKRIDVHCTWAGICAEATTAGRHRSEGVGCSSVWQTLCSPDPADTWKRMEAMLEPVLAKLEAGKA